MRTALALLLAAALSAGCAGFGTRQAPYRTGEKPGFPKLGAALPAGGTAFSDASLAAVFTTLAFDFEWGAARPGLVRLAAPVRVGLEGAGAEQYGAFLAGYLRFLAQGTGIDIAPAGAAADGAAANLHVRLVDGVAFAQVLPGAACVVAPGEVAWSAMRSDPSGYGGDAMAAVRDLAEVTVFIPDDAAPHQIRGCLIEEVAQALGLVNDLYGLGPSIFNDDAAHLWPTALDLMMLRVLYAPELVPGMDRGAAEAAARQALARLNPAGQAAPDLRLVPDAALGDWRALAQKVHRRDAEPATREARARAALDLVSARAPGSPQHCLGLTTLGRALSLTRPAEAAGVLAEARALCARVHGPGDIRLARLGLDQAIAHLRAGDARAALAAAGGVEAALADHAQDEALATLYAVRARAYRALQQGERAFEAQRRAAEWGAYAFGADNAALARALAR
ncbi:MAG: DUF2927 domain-containing protein [Thermohalobaculum sp.]|nr:DUF2927 domain-containing protein [Thermohalobaculum sp.]